MDVAERDRAVVALDHERVLRGFGDWQVRARRTVDVHVLLDEMSVEEHAQESRRLGFLST
jgi:hypothetical protein